MKKCKVIFILILMVLMTGSSFLTYSFNIESKQGNFLRAVNAEKSLSLAYIDYIYVHGYDLEPEMNYETFEYEVKVPVNTKKLELSARPQSIYNSLEIVGNDNLKNGSVVKLIVTSGDKAISREYSIKVVYSNSKLIYKIIIIILIVIILITIIIAVIYILNLKGIIHIEFKKKNKEKIGEENYVK